MPSGWGWLGAARHRRVQLQRAGGLPHRGGKITRPLKSATLIGTGPQVLKEISMVGRDLALSAGMCGSVSGSIPASVGQPPLKVDNILVGGNA